MRCSDPPACCSLQMADALLHMKETYAEEVGRRHNLLKQYQEMEKQRLRHMVYLLQEAMQEVKGMQSAEVSSCYPT